MIRNIGYPFLIIVLVFGRAETQCWAAEVPSGRLFRVQEFGAVADGTTLNTAAIQKAVDTCSESGGGCVCFSPGVYLSGTVFLKDNVRLVLEANAVFRGSPRPEDYPPIPRKNARGNPAFAIPTFSNGGFLIYADGVRNVSIEGRGMIDGQGSEFWFKEMLSPMVRKPRPNRPRALIGIIKGESILIRDVTLLNSPCFTLWLIGCNNANIDGVAIQNPYSGPNTDGIDIDCCSNVHVANCSIDGGDDAIAIKSDAGLLGEDKPCENITVTNCTLCSKPACAVRIGYEGDSVIRNCTFSNLTIVDSTIGLDVVCVRPGGTILKGTRCENITFNNIVMRNVDQAIYFWMGHEPGGESQISLKNILVSNVIAQSRFGSYVGGFDQRHCENMTLSNLQILVTGEMPKGVTPTTSGVWGAPMNPYGLYCTRVDGLRIRDVDIDLREAHGAWRYGLFCDKVSDADIRGIRTYGLGALSAQAAIGLKKTKASVRDCDAEPGVPTFLHAAEGSHVFVSGCDLSGATKSTAVDGSSSIDTSTERSH